MTEAIAKYLHEDEITLIPEPIRPLLQDLNRDGMTVEGANRVLSDYQYRLYPQGWTFHSLNDGFLEEWNMAFIPPEDNRAFCFQRFNAIPDDPWCCYIVENI